MSRKWIRSLIPYSLTAEACSLISCMMLFYCQTGNTSLYSSIFRLSCLMLIGLPLTLFSLSWIIDVYLRHTIKYLIDLFHRRFSPINFHELFRLPQIHVMKAFVITHVMYACVMIGILLWPVLCKVSI